MIKRIIDSDIFHEVADATEYCALGRFLPIKNIEKARIVDNYKVMNDTLETPALIIMTPTEIKNSFKESWNCFFLADMTSGYHQIPIEEKFSEVN